MVSQTPCRRHIWQPRILIGSFYSARPRESGDPDRDSGLDSQHKRVHARLDISAFTRVSTRYARE